MIVLFVRTDLIAQKVKTVTNISFSGNNPNYDKTFTITSDCDIWITGRINSSIMGLGQIYINNFLGVQVQYGGATTGIVGMICKKGSNIVRVKYNGGTNSFISGIVEVLYPDGGTVTVTSS